MRVKRFPEVLIPLKGEKETNFYTGSGLLVAKGYTRVVVGDRGPYIESSEDQIIKENIEVRLEDLWRLASPIVYVEFWRSKDKKEVLVWHQRREVRYADYKVGMWYISPFYLASDKYPQILEWRI